MPGRALLSSTVVLAVAVAAAAQRPPAPDTLWDARAEGAGDFKTVLEVSGRVEMALYRASADPTNLESLCRASTETESTALADVERRLESLRRAAQPGIEAKLDLAWTEYTLGQIHTYNGEMTRAAERFDAARAIVEPLAAGSPPMAAVSVLLDQILAVTHLRRGEVENCVHHPNAERCIFPIRGGGVHDVKSGSERAVEHFSRALAADPDNLELRWLLNLAYMTLGTYPAGVPAALLLPRARFDGADTPAWEDVSRQSGVDVRSRAGGTVIDDLDGDGRLDIAFTSVGACEPMRLFHNRGGGEFEDLTERAGLLGQTGGLNLSHVDYDNDGRIDLFVHRGGWESPMRNSLLRNNGEGTFEDVTAKAGVLGRRAHRTHSAAWADFDNDGHVDLFLAHEQSPSVLYRNRGDGTFEDVTARAGVGRTSFAKGAAWGDFDNDGFADLYVSNYTERNLFYRNRGDGTFEEMAEALGVDRPLMSFTTWFFDYDNDGWLDLFVASFVPSVTEVVRGFLGLPRQAETMRLYRNTGRGGFEDVTGSAGLDRVVPTMGANFGDIDNDGWLDLYLGTGAPSYAALMPNFMFRNRGGRFEDVTASSGTGHLQKGHGVAFGDLDDDGRDEMVVNVGGFVPGDAYWKAVFKSTGPAGTWLTVQLRGVKSNRLGVGARLTAVTRDAQGNRRALHRVVSSGGSFGASPYRQHFGLDGAATVESLEVVWPASGTRQRFTEIAAGQTIEIREDSQTIRVVAPSR